MAEASESSCQSGIQATLGSHDVHAIANELAPVAHKWMLVGTCLDVNHSELKEIEGRRHISAKQSLLEVITRWLDTNRSVTWNDILKALREPLVSEQRLAKEIEEHVLFKKTVRKSLSSPPEAECDHPSTEYMRSESSPAFVQASVSADCSQSQSQPSVPISPEGAVISHVCATSSPSLSPVVQSNLPIMEARSSLSSLQSNRSVQEKNLPSIRASCATGNPSSHESNVPLSPSPSSDLSTGGENTRPPYGCGCGECPVQDFFIGNCPKPIRTISKFRYLNTSGLNEEEREDLEIQLHEDFLEINDKYASLTSSLRRSLRERRISPKELVECLMDVQGYQPISKSTDDCEKSIQLLEDRYSEMERAEDIAGVFKILSDYCSFLNYGIIVFITRNLGSDSDKQNLATYESDIEAYCRHHVFECPYFSRKNWKFPDLILKVDDKALSGYTLSALRSFTTKIARVLKVTKHCLMVHGIKEGCLEIKFQIPPHIKDAVFPLSNDQLEMLKQLGVQRIVCGGAQFLPEDSTQKAILSNVPVSFASTDQEKQQQKKQSHDQAGLQQKQSTMGAFKSKHLTQQGGQPEDDRSSVPHASVRRRTCLELKLLQRCQYGNRCRFSHSEIPLSFEPAMEYIPIPSSTSLSRLRSCLGKPDRGPKGKGFIAVESDRAHGSPEIKIVAEDVSTLKFAREIILKKFTLPPGQEVQHTARECVMYKLLGKCSHDPCIFVHGDIVESPSIGYVTHPIGKIPNLKKAIGHVGHCKSGAGSYLTALSDRDRNKEVKVIAENDEALKNAKKKIEIFLSQSHAAYSKITAASLALCYIHPEGLETQYQLKLHCEEGGKHQYTIECSHEEATSTIQSEIPSVKDFEHLNKEFPNPVKYMLDHPEEAAEIRNSFSAQVRLLEEYGSQIHGLLHEALKWMYRKNLHPKLEGRFGKLQWAKIPPSLYRGPLDIKGFIDFISTNSSHQRRYRPQIEEANAFQAVRMLTDLGSVVESYDLKVAIKNKGKVDIRLKFVDGKPEIMAVRKDEEKLLIADILCLHRKHDLRLSLSSYDVVPHEDPTVQRFVSHITSPEAGVLIFVPQPSDKEWIAAFVRHKMRRAYLYGKKNYIVTLSHVKWYDFKSGDINPLKQEELLLAGNDWREHYEIEVLNLDWEVDFGRQFDLNPEESLSLLIDPTKIPPEVKTSPPRQWNPESIMADFEGDEFLQMMDDINRTAEVAVNA